jgi:hypothetical protein
LGRRGDRKVVSVVRVDQPDHRYGGPAGAEVTGDKTMPAAFEPWCGWG